MFEPKATAPHLDSTKTGKSQIENNNTASPSKADVSIAAASQIAQASPHQPR
jgi:hypothetical protein